MTKIINTIRNLRDRASASVTIKRQNILFYTAIILVFLIAILIRLSPLLESEHLIKAFDPWMQYYNTNYLVENGIYDYFNWHDFKSWYPAGIDRSMLRPGLQFTTAAFYEILNFIGIKISVYDACYYFPPVMAGLTVLAIYFLGKEILDRKCGLLAAFFLAFSPGYMQRTVAGFYDNETIGVFAIIMTFLFFLKTLKTGRTTYAIAGGVFSGYLALSWGGADFVFYTIPIVCIILIILNKYNANVLIAYAGVQGVGMLLNSLYKFYVFGNLFSSIESGGLLFLTVLVIFFHILYSKKKTNPILFNKIMTIIKWGIIPAAIGVVVITWAAPGLIPFGIGARLQSVLNPLFRNQINLVASVAEHMPTSWSTFYYDLLIPLSLLPLGVYFCFKRYNYADIFLLVFTLLLFYFTGSMVRIILAFAPAGALMGAYGLSNVLKIYGSHYGKKGIGVSRKRTKLLKRKRALGKKEIYSVYLIVGFLCFVQVSHAIDTSISMAPGQMVPGGVLHDWEESLNWMKENLPGDTVVVSWWDYGYWLTPVGNMTSVCDNANIRAQVNGLVGMAMMQTDEIYSAKILKLLQADYVLVYFGFLIDSLGGDEGKWQWMLRICNDYYEQYKAMGLEEDNWAENSVFDEAEYIDSDTYQYKPSWFSSQLAKLMFWGVPTSGDYPSGSIYGNYINLVNNRAVADENEGIWVDYIAPQGKYYSDVFLPEDPSNPEVSGYFSQNLLVKLYKMDYTPLESQFRILNPQIYDTGYGTLRVKNTGTKNITIEEVTLNGNITSTFDTGNIEGDNIIAPGEEEIVWFDAKEDNEPLYDNGETVKITVGASSIKDSGSLYEFENSTSNLFVKEAQPGKLQIVRENSYVMYNEETGKDDAYIQVKNIGANPIVIDKFYVNSEENHITEGEYIEGSSIIEPQGTADAHLKNIPIAFTKSGTNDILGTINNITVLTKNGINDTASFTSNYKSEDYNFKMTIIPDTRMPSPELMALYNYSIRNYITQDLNTNAIRNQDGTTQINFTVKNTGDNTFSLSGLSLLDGDWNLINPLKYDWDPIGSYFLSPNEERRISINVDSGILDVNDQVGFNITAYFDTQKVASDVGFMHVINSSALGDLKLFDVLDGFNASYLNSTSGEGWTLVKNVGSIDLNLDVGSCITIDGYTAINVNIIYGDSELAPQECVLLEFTINPSQTITHLETYILRVQTVEGIFDEISLTAYNYT
ncbi:MAG: glycosyltransferase family 39 protein [Candidatus Lokiarchaeota archaeon]|nr:glycosyltransferase family 39 protein [Candidatus Lokiarchaeota archaeon]